MTATFGQQNQSVAVLHPPGAKATFPFTSSSGGQYAMNSARPLQPATTPWTDAQARDASTDPVYVTQPYLPPLEEFLPYLQDIWERKVLTNNGPCHQELEWQLCQYLGVEHISLFANGTLALVTALQALRITGEVITTPYSFVATSHALLWNGIKPVFVDIEPETLNLDPAKIEAAITPQTTAILPVHCYGRRCAVDAIESIADNYGLKVIYDAAHAFGVKDDGGGIVRHGDLSVLSFHATKVFNTFEGGAIISPDARTKRRIDHLKNFGFVDETTVVAPGINGKMSEINAAFGLLQLQHIDKALARREQIDTLYRRLLQDVPGITLPPRRQYGSNFAYFPVLVGPGYPIERDDLYAVLREHQIYARRYFHPLISQFPMYRGLPGTQPENLPVATAAAREILCLPIYPALEDATIERIVSIVAHAGRHTTVGR
ncbi:DegT/DnrJ/EryC1/StrS family aminotransferase [Pseudoxanthomonas sp. JBR18]|uniref:DegT/DnrJ/EryC1/StrS family aminotransferase n=1 Tax=Pseudoxanthomonas sp. JBR18 TaxID=2969308 RepID=UPI00230650D4|nr:DegT/DnrJ/EryC1/StrS family aminotransferase [Pseudoxanthomonas sp. JBR18]WCE03217.1 DegT/DnrJ/EryC1/StrS family aminotransferase [Pseudoxanthomonas sp. JBR18]